MESSEYTVLFIIKKIFHDIIAIIGLRLGVCVDAIIRLNYDAILLRFSILLFFSFKGSVMADCRHF